MDEVFLVIHSAHDLIIGDLWLAKHRVLADSEHHRLIFPVPLGVQVRPGAKAKCVGELPCERCHRRDQEYLWIERVKLPIGHNDPKGGPPGRLNHAEGN